MTYEIWISQGKDRLRLPVLPIESGLQIEAPTSNESHKVSKLGEITVLQDPDARKFSFRSFFPAKYGPYCEYRIIPKPWKTIKRLEKWKDSGSPVRFIFTGNINELVSIESLSYFEHGGEVGDIYFDIVLKEYQQISVRQVKHKPAPRPKPPPKPKPKKKKATSKPAPRTHTVKRGDTLWALAGRYYGNNLQWRKIWNQPANRKMMIARDKRNLRMPGHWIFPGQKLIIP